MLMTYLDPSGQLDSLPDGAVCTLTHVDQSRIRTGEPSSQSRAAFVPYGLP